HRSFTCLPRKTVMSQPKPSSNQIVDKKVICFKRNISLPVALPYAVNEGLAPCFTPRALKLHHQQLLLHWNRLKLLIKGIYQISPISHSSILFSFCRNQL